MLQLTECFSTLLNISILDPDHFGLNFSRVAIAADRVEHMYLNSHVVSFGEHCVEANTDNQFLVVRCDLSQNRYKEENDRNMFDKNGVDEDVSSARPVGTRQVRALPPEVHRASSVFMIAAIPDSYNTRQIYR